ncbi:MAG: 4Fe-4S dicluster domain-containing protein [Anaerolineaceae bacterium]|nr:4Fe-4S dicluster domain-containing protein [Anaerolineaceae bacterium]
MRAANISFVLAVVSAVLFSTAFLLPVEGRSILAYVLFAVVLISVILFFLPFKTIVQPDAKPGKRVDERDIMFARARLQPGSAAYEDYYQTKPETKIRDDLFRKEPGLLNEKARFYDPILFSTSKGGFFLTEALRDTVDGAVAGSKVDTSNMDLSSYMKSLARYMGAIHVGIAKTKPYHYYSHIGRGTGVYGDEIKIEHKYALVFSVEMDYEMIGANPLAPGVVESAREYIEAAKIAVVIAATIREMGYEARAHIDGNYRVIAPLIARDAGLGEIGRMGLLITPNLGPRVRLGVVTTNLPLKIDDRNLDPSVIDFCNICRKCASGCPTQAISFEARQDIDGALRWKLDSDRCFKYWVQCGTDCGRCMTICPYAHKDNYLHKGIRWGIKKSWLFRRFALNMDDFFYGKKPSRRTPPKWMCSIQHKIR